MAVRANKSPSRVQQDLSTYEFLLQSVGTCARTLVIDRYAYGWWLEQSLRTRG